MTQPHSRKDLLASGLYAGALALLTLWCAFSELRPGWVGQWLLLWWLSFLLLRVMEHEVTEDTVPLRLPLLLGVTGVGLGLMTGHSLLGELAHAAPWWMRLASMGLTFGGLTLTNVALTRWTPRLALKESDIYLATALATWGSFSYMATVLVLASAMGLGTALLRTRAHGEGQQNFFKHITRFSVWCAAAGWIAYWGVFARAVL